MSLAGPKRGKPDWLAPSVACDIAVDAADPAAAEAAARRALGGAPVDLALQPAAGRRKRLLVADMESTIIRNEMLDELAEFAGIRDRIAAITRRAMNGELDFAAALRERVGLLKGLDAAILEQAAARIAIMPGAAALVRTMRAHGAYTALVSGGFRVFTGRVAKALGFDEDAANVLEIADGRLAGTVAEPILGRDAKLATLEARGRRARPRPGRRARGRRRRQRPRHAEGRRARRRLPRQARGRRRPRVSASTMAT